MYYEAAHEVRDEAKLAEITESMRANGWVGAPLVAWQIDGCQAYLLTGAHRIEAARAAGLVEDNYDEESAIPLITLEEVCYEAGLDLAELVEETGADWHSWDGIVALVERLPQAVAVKYGLDAN